MPRYLFIFGFETPAMIESNRKWGSDFEDSHAVFIKAENEGQALEFGKNIAAQFFIRMWNSLTPSTTLTDYAHWVEEIPETESETEALSNIVTLRAGDSDAARNLIDAWIAVVAGL